MAPGGHKEDNKDNTSVTTDDEPGGVYKENNKDGTFDTKITKIMLAKQLMMDL